MKNGKKLNRGQRDFVKSKRLNPENWLVVKNLHDVMHIVHRVSGKIRVLHK